MKELKGEYLCGYLAELEEADIKRILQWRNEPRVRLNMYSRHEISLEEHLKWWDNIKNDSKYKYFMYKEGECPLGVVCFTQINDNSKNAMWGFYTAPHAKKGSGTRLGICAFDYAFNKRLWYKIYAEVLALNKPSIGLHLKLGFIQEGHFERQHNYDGVLIDIYRLALFSDRWSAIREKLIKTR